MRITPQVSLLTELEGKEGFVDQGNNNDRCFVANVGDRLKEGRVTYNVVNGDSTTNGAGLVVVTGLLKKESTNSPSTQTLTTIAEFTDAMNDNISHQVTIKAGCDYFHYKAKDLNNRNDPTNKNSEVIVFRFAAVEQNRQAKITFFVHGVNRSGGNEVLFLSGNGDPPPNLVEIEEDNETTRGQAKLDKKTNYTILEDNVQRLGSDWAPAQDSVPPGLIANNGLSWDTFGQFSGIQTNENFSDPDLRGVIKIPAGATFASFQLVSPPLPRQGESATLSLAILELFAPGEN